MASRTQNSLPSPPHRSAKMIFFIVFCTLVGFSKSDEPCGIVTSTTGRLRSPNYPYAAPPNTNCVWTFQPFSTQTKWLFLVFDDFHLTQDDYLMIEEKNATHNFQGIKGQFIVAVDPSSKITFHTTAKSDNSYFSTSFNNQSCMTTTDAGHGFLQAPIYARRMLADTFTCSWLISASGSSKSLLVSFAEFKLNSSFVSVYKDNSEVVAKYSGNTIPQDVIVGSLLAKVEVLVQVSSPVINFKAEFATVSLDCAKTMQVTDPIVLNEIIVVPEPVECVWILKSDPKTTLMAKTVEMNLLNLQDTILLSDGNSRYSPILEMVDHTTKNVPDSFITSSGNLLYISFLSVPIVGLSNFKMNITAQTQGGTFYNQGKFNFDQTPSFKGQDIVFTLVVNSSLMIEVTIEAKNLQNTSEILFYDLQENGKILLAVFNKDTEVFPVFSKSNKVIVVLRGFVGTEELTGNFHGIVRGCDTFDQTNVGSYELQKNVSGNCTWLIKPTGLVSGDMISLTFSKLILNNKDILAIYKGLSNNHEDLVQIFNSQIHGQPQLYIEARNGIRLDMQISSIQDKTQVISFYELQGGCNSNITISPGEEIDISSVGYPSHYLLNRNCEWHVFAPENSTLFVKFVDVDIYTDNNLQLFNLKNGSEELIGSTDGRIYPNDVIENSEELIIKWNSTSQYEPRPARGFLLRIRMLDCGTNLTTQSGAVSTPDYPYPVNQTVECIWGIAVAMPNSASVNIIHFSLNITPSAENPSTFQIFDGGSLTSSILSIKTNDTNLSRTNKLMVRYSNKGGIGSGYQLSFSSKECTPSHQCRNKICMHDDWRCNGINNCGDFSDEENCDSFGRKPGVSMPWFSASVVLALLFGIALTILVPIGIRRFHRWKQERRPSSFSILPDETETFD
uniref:CUB domain-containing protein n=1 Tax=Strigamia maritima TaxID=126957 RepID=T1JGI2_STRMM